MTGFPVRHSTPRLPIWANTSMMAGSSSLLWERSRISMDWQSARWLTSSNELSELYESSTEQSSCKLAAKQWIWLDHRVHLLLVKLLSSGWRASLDIPKFSMRWILFPVRLKFASLANFSKFSILLIRFCCRKRLRSSVWWSRFSIFCRPLLPRNKQRSPVYASRFSIRGYPATQRNRNF